MVHPDTAAGPVRAARRTMLAIAAVLPAGLFLAGCDETPQAKAQQSPPAPEVTVMAVNPQPVSIHTTLPGRTVAFQVAEVRPQVGGVLRERLFREGEAVEAGQKLFQIDPAPYRAQLASAEAGLERAQAQLSSARVTATRYAPLVRQNAVSRLDYETAVATQKEAEAAVASARASVETAKINLGYTTLNSPIPGRTGRARLTVGALVTADQAEPLLTVTQLDPIYVDVTQPATTLLRLRREMEAGRIRRAEGDAAEVRLLLEDGTEYAHAGMMQFSEVTVDPSTGSVVLRAEFPNPEGLLMPGMFVRQKVEEGISQNALLVPQRAVTRNPRGEAVVKVVQPDGTVAERTIDANRAIGTDWLAQSGLNAGDKVIVEGGQRVQAGARPQVSEITRDELGRNRQTAQQAPNRG
ncbi:efflux RND transporter periplasmic adaptor subunit [Pseudoroseomonas globiformis]|uniref:Efflux RND transporter periplasmic adaptor subunit n=1 Tax=Teichococcus globiformis TaxID=2307229 RepID=A0ABV7FZ64_9PROT